MAKNKTKEELPEPIDNEALPGEETTSEETAEQTEASETTDSPQTEPSAGPTNADIIKEQAKVLHTANKDGMVTLVSGAEYFDFEVNPVFDGTYLRPMYREKDGAKGQHAGDLIGFYFADGDGEEHIIGNSHAIEKAITMIKPGRKLRITFQGQTLNAKNQKVNKFKVEAYPE